MQLKQDIKLKPGGGKYSKPAIWVFVVLSVLLIYAPSCIKDVDIPIKDVENMLVLKCLFTEMQEMKVILGQSIPIGKEYAERISGANVVLYLDDYPYDTLNETEPGIYFSDIIPEQYKRYKLICEAKGFQTITSNVSEIPEKCEIISATIKDSVAIDESDIVSEIRVVFSDPPAQNNFYDLDILYINNDSLTDIKYYSAYYRDLGKEPVLINEGLLKYYPSSLIFSDVLFNGNIYDLRVNVIYKDYDVMIILRRISEDLYNYLKTLTLYSNSVDYSLWGSAEPINVISNIHNGFGIFSGYSADTLYLLHHENR